jgi:hypothetical protein
MSVTLKSLELLSLSEEEKLTEKDKNKTKKNKFFKLVLGF